MDAGYATDRNRFLRATFLRVFSFPEGGLPYFETSICQTVDGDDGMRSRKRYSNHRRTGGWGWGDCSPPQFFENLSIRAKIILSFGQRRSGD